MIGGIAAVVDYEFYTNTYHGGDISADEWPAAERDASATLEKFKRMYRINGDETAEKMAICAMADVSFSYSETSSGGAVTSASIGSVSESYAASASPSENARSRQKDLYSAASLYLDIYRGCGPWPD